MAASAGTALSVPPKAVAGREVAGAPSLDLHLPAEPATSRSLQAIVAGEIIPRLMLAHGRTGSPPSTEAMDVAGFTPLTLETDAVALLAHVDRLLAGGVTVETVMVDLLAPAARLLGRWWEEDRCDFVEVTMGLWRLQEVVRELSRRDPPTPRRNGRRALVTSFPGEQHDFGAAMVSELLERHGWTADLLVAADMPELLAAVGAADYDLVGLTVSCDCHSARLPSAILAIRSVSSNPRVRVLVGGRVLNDDPALAGRVGADGTASDARQALLLAEELVAEAASIAGRDWPFAVT